MENTNIQFAAEHKIIYTITKQTFIMKKLYYTFTHQGVLTAWYTAPESCRGNQEPQAGGFARGNLHRPGTDQTSTQQNYLTAGDTPAVVATMFGYRHKYGNN
jgi:hypothetical protein